MNIQELPEKGGPFGKGLKSGHTSLEAPNSNLWIPCAGTRLGCSEA